MARGLPSGGPDARSGSACKPGSVPRAGCPARGESHSSRPTIARRLEHSHPDTATTLARHRSSGPLSTVSLFELAPGGACLAAGHPAVARGLLPHDFTLACSHRPCERRAIGGVISVALSLGSPRVGVTDLPVLRSPDFPPVNGVCSPATFRPTSAGGAHPIAARHPSQTPQAKPGQRAPARARCGRFGLHYRRPANRRPTDGPARAGRDRGWRGRLDWRPRAR